MKVSDTRYRQRGRVRLLPRSPRANLRNSKSLSYAAVPSATLVPNVRQLSQYVIIP